MKKPELIKGIREHNGKIDKKNVVKTSKTEKVGEIVNVLKKREKHLKREKSPVRDEYRFNIDTHHMNYVFEETPEGMRAVGFTTRSKTFGKKNMPLAKNPKKGDTHKSYVRNGIIESERKSFSKKKAKNYSLVGEDKANVKSKIRNYKKNRKTKKT